MAEIERTQNEAAEILDDIKAFFIAFAEAFQKAYAESFERAIKFWNGLNEIMCEIDENKNRQTRSRQRVAKLPKVKSYHHLLRFKRMNDQVTHRTPMHPVRKII